MTNTILLKRSDVANTVPLTENLIPGELALNFADGNLFFKDTSNNIVLLTSTQFVNVLGNVTGGNLNTGGSLTATGNITGGNVITAGQVSATGNVTGNFLLGNGSQLSGINAFSTIEVIGQDNIVANSISDTLTISGGDGIAIQTDAESDTLTISLIGAGSAIFATGGDMGTVEEAVTISTDLGLIIDSIVESYDLGTIVTGGLIYPNQFVLPGFTVAELANTAPSPAGQMAFCTNDAGGSVPVFSDGTDWRRVTDRQIAS